MNNIEVKMLEEIVNKNLKRIEKDLQEIDDIFNSSDNIAATLPFPEAGAPNIIITILLSSLNL